MATPPAIRADRTLEDYSYLADPAQRTGPFDPVKFVPLSGDGAVYASFGGEVRNRSEFLDAPDFAIGGEEADTYHLVRVLAHADIHLGPAVRLFAQLGAHEAVDKRILTPPDENGVDVHQLFLDVKPAPPLTLRLGRQEMMFNAVHRFICSREGANVRQAFDGGRLTFDDGRLRLEAFLARPVALEYGSFDDGSDDRQTFAGVYASRQLAHGRPISLDAYWLLLDREGLGPPVDGRERRHSFGLRFAGAADGWDWDIETMLQTGRAGGKDIRAWVVAADVGYRFDAPLKPRLGFRLDAGSGDDDPGDDRIGGFHPLFPKGGYLSEANIGSWTNLLAMRPGVTLAPARNLTVETAVHLKWREDRDDAVYVGPSRPLLPTLGNRAREIGQALIVDVNYQASRHLSLRGYYMHHSAGNAIARAGGQAQDFVMVTATFRF